MTSLRKNEVPICGTLLWLKNATTPLGFTHDTTLQDKYIKNVLDACTNPGCTGGSNTHTHASTGGHTHSVTGTHTHTLGTGAQSGTNFTSPSGGTSVSVFGHSHSKTSGSAGSSTTSTCDGAHSQSCQPSQPIHTEYKYITKNPIIGIRVKDVPQDGIILWTKPLACIPTHYSKDVSHLDRFIKGTATDCVSPGCDSGLATHIHGSEGSHSHTDIITTHGHTYTATFGVGASAGGGISSPALTAGGHTHTGNTTDTDRADCCVTSDSKCHDHGTSDNNPAHTTAAILKHNIITMRKIGVPIKAAILFNKPLNCIPVDYGLQDGTLGTTDTLDKMIRVIPTACASPGTNTGAANHQHTATTAHDHSFTSPHAHTTAGGCTNVVNFSVGQNSAGPIRATTHSHTINTTTSAGTARISCTADTHQHTTSDSRPAFVDVAIIERLN